MERSPPHQVQVHPQRYEGSGIKTQPHKGPTASKVLAVITLFPVGGTLLMLAGITLVGTLIGMAVTTPLFIICSPVLVPAAIAVALAVTAFLASGVFGLTGLTSLSWFFNYLRQATASIPDQFDQAKRHMQDIVAQAGQKTKDVGQTIQTKAQEGGRTT